MGKGLAAHKNLVDNDRVAISDVTVQQTASPGYFLTHPICGVPSLKIGRNGDFVVV